MAKLQNIYGFAKIESEFVRRDSNQGIHIKHTLDSLNLKTKAEHTKVEMMLEVSDQK